jgi:nucleotide-binding universal stress UspA family protein
MSGFRAKKIVVPVDFSADSHRAIRTALELAPGPSAIHAVHVLFPLESATSGILWGEVSDEDRRQAAQAKFEELIHAHGLGEVRAEILIGDPGLEIADYAQRIGADLIVIPSHGYHGVKRLVLGSVAERVIRHAACSVLVLRRSDAE